MHQEPSYSKTTTLTNFIRENQKRYVGAKGELSHVLMTIALGTKIVSQGVNRAGLASMLGLTGEKNVQGESVQKLDIYADQVFASVLGRSGEFFSMVSEEREKIFSAKKSGDASSYVIAFDPVDGSSNIDVNVAIGSIWGIYRRVSDGSKVDPEDLSDFLQPGRNQIAAGYTVYGSSTVFVFTTGDGVHGFTLDPTIGEYILTHERMTIPSKGNIYSCNEGNYHSWQKGVQQYVDWAKSESEGKSPYSGRYVGSLVADFHRTLHKGGIFLYPADKKNKEGKLRVLYESAPLSFIIEQAGGRAITGEGNLLDVTPSSIHQRSPLMIGSKENVDEFERIAKG